jgi:hypothetical protein
LPDACIDVIPDELSANCATSVPNNAMSGALGVKRGYLASRMRLRLGESRWCRVHKLDQRIGMFVTETFRMAA